MIPNPCIPAAVPGTPVGPAAPRGPARTNEPGRPASIRAADGYSASMQAEAFRKIVGGYDITSISRTEMQRMSQDLYDHGLISLREHGSLTFDPTRLGRDIERATGIRVGDSITVSGWKMSADPGRKMNFLEGLKAQAEWNRKYGNPAFQANYDGMVALAERIHHFQA